MTRSETLAGIKARLDGLDDESLVAVADMIASLERQPQGLGRPLTERELALIEQSKRDFAEGRTYSVDEAFAFVDARLAAKRAE